MASVLAIGVATLDLVFQVDHFPSEDEEMRAGALCRQRGGNATNALVVLSQLGHHCSWAGNLADDANAQLILDDLATYSIDSAYCTHSIASQTPLSAVFLNQQKGSRTIVHYRELAEFSFDAFRKIPLDAYDWLHFEGRNITETLQMLRHIRAQDANVMVSVEIEKHRKGIEMLYPFADVLMFSSAFAASSNNVPKALLERIRPDTQAMLFCSCGETGAIALDSYGHSYSSPAFQPKRLVDSLGAGDTFNASIIHGLLEQSSMPDLLERACRLAGKKCGQSGFSNLVT